MNKVKKSCQLGIAALAFLAICCAQLAPAGNKGQVFPNGLGKLESSITYGAGLGAAKEPPPLGANSTTSVSLPAAGVNVSATTGFPTSGNVATADNPSGTPS